MHPPIQLTLAVSILPLMCEPPPRGPDASAPPPADGMCATAPTDAAPPSDRGADAPAGPGALPPAAEVDVRQGLVVASVESRVARPARRPFDDARLAAITVPPGFRVNVFMRGLTEPRVLAAAPNGGVYVAEREAGRVTLLRDTDGDGVADSSGSVATGLGAGRQGVHGLAVRGAQLFMATATSLHVAAIAPDGSLGPPTTLAIDLPDPGQHPNRTLGVAPDGTVLLSLGSPCNDCPPGEEEATLVRLTGGGGSRTVFARGLRNTIGFAWHPVTRQLWGLDHGSDGRGDETPPEELNRIVEGRNYGWPSCWGPRQVDLMTSQDPATGTRAEFCRASEPSTLTYRAHAAPMQMAYYTGAQFPPEYRNDAFVTMHGSWNRNPPMGYEVVRVRHDAAGNPTAVEPFAAGWLIEGGRAYFGRPMGLLVATDGALLVGDDANGVIYRISHPGGG